MTHQIPQYRNRLIIFPVTILLFVSSCCSYRVTTQAQPGSEISKPIVAKVYFWGLIQKPKEIHASLCDSLGVNGVAEVTMKRNFGQALVTVFTLGIYSPIQVQWKCSKPCKKSGVL